MAKYTLDAYLRLLFDMDSSGEFILADDEYIRLFVANKSSSQNIYVKTVKEIKAVIRKYHDNYNLYIGLATTRGKDGKAEHMRTRKVLMLDFDKKDYPDFKSVEDFTAMLKKRMSMLYIHMIVDSGNGYHFYVAINKTVNAKRVADVNRTLAEIVGADLKATLITQIVRIPTSLNVKDMDNKKPVNIIINDLESRAATFKPYHLQKIEGMIERAKQNAENIKAYEEKHNIEALPPKECPKSCGYYCVECMLSKGCKQGQRNFALGRITKYLQLIRGYAKSHALKAVKDWNKRCQPPKAESEVERDFNNYWEKPYKLLACSVPDKTDQDILDIYCDRLKCNTIWEKREEGTAKAEEMYFDNKFLKNAILRDLTGIHLLILSVLDFVNKPLTKRKLTEYLTGSKEKCRITAPTLNKYLTELVKRKYVTYDDFREAYTTNHKGYTTAYIRYSYSASVLLINNVIKPPEYAVYLCLLRNLQQNIKVTYDEIADNLNDDKGNISRYIKHLHKAGLINIDVGYENGKPYNVYKIFY